MAYLARPAHSVFTPTLFLLKKKEPLDERLFDALMENEAIIYLVPQSHKRPWPMAGR